MSYTLRFRNVLSGDIASPIDKNVEITADGLTTRSLTIAASTTDQQVIVAFTTAALKGCYLVSTQDITIETNSSSAPDDTITLSANEPLVWHTDCGLTIPFSANVTTLYLTTGAISASATVTLVFLHDTTP